jgi:hypothetical protein
MKNFFNKLEKFNFKKIINTEGKFSNLINSNYKIFNFKSIDKNLSNTIFDKNNTNTYLFNKEKNSDIKKIILEKKNKIFYNKFLAKKNVWSSNGKKGSNLVSLNKSEFKNGKYEVVSAKSYNKFELGLYYSVQFLNYYLIYKVITRFLSLKFIRGFFYLILTAGVSRFNWSYTKNRKIVIKSITLFSCGRRVKVSTLQEDLFLDISSFREFDEQEKKHVSKFFLGEKVAFLPLNINNEIYVLTQKCIMQNKEVFFALKNGNYIDIIDDENDNNEDEDEDEDDDDGDKFNKKKKRKNNIIIDI